MKRKRVSAAKITFYSGLDTRKKLENLLFCLFNFEFYIMKEIFLRKTRLIIITQIKIMGTKV